MGQPSLQGAGVGALGYANLIPETYGPGFNTTLGGASATIAAGATTLTLNNAGFLGSLTSSQITSYYIWFDDGGMPSNQAEVPNLNEPPIQISSISSGVITIASATTQTHYGPQSTAAPQSGSRVHISMKPANGKGLYYTSQTLMKKTSPWSPQLIRNDLEGYPFVLQGHETVAGNIVGPIAPGWNGDLLAVTFGYEQETYAASATGALTLSASTTAGATTITTAANTGLTAGTTVIQIDSTPNRECRKITTIAGAGPYTLTLDSPLSFAHTSGAAVQVATGPYTHSIVLGKVSGSVAVEKFASGDVQWQGTPGTLLPTSFAYCGLYVDQLQIKNDNKTGPVGTWSLKGLGEYLIPSTQAGTYPTALPYTFDNFFMKVNGVQDTTFTDLELTIKKSLQEVKTLDASRKTNVIRPALRMIDGKASLYFSSTQAYQDFTGNVSKTLAFNWYQASTGYNLAFNFTNVRYTEFDVKDGVNAAVMADITFRCALDSGTGTAGTLTVTDGTYTRYGI